MTQIELFNLAKMRNNEHFRYMTDVENLIIKYTPEKLGVVEQYPVFQAAKVTLDEVIKVAQKSSKTLLVENADALRGLTVSAINGLVKAMFKSPFANEVESARLIKIIIDNYGDLSKMSYNEQTSATDNMVADLQKSENAEDLSRTLLGPWVGELKKQNEDFQALLDNRNEEYALRSSGNVLVVRKTIDTNYELIIGRVNATLFLGLATNEATKFAKELNKKIKYFLDQYNKRNGKKDNEK